MNTCLLKAFFGGGEQVVGAASLGGASAQLSRDLRRSAPAPAGRGPDDRDRRRRAGPGGECAGAADAAASGFPASSCAKTTTFQFPYKSRGENDNFPNTAIFSYGKATTFQNRRGPWGRICFHPESVRNSDPVVIICYFPQLLPCYCFR